MVVVAVVQRHFNKWNASCFHFILILVIRFSFVVDGDGGGVVVVTFSADVFDSFVLVSFGQSTLWCMLGAHVSFFSYFFFYGSYYSWHHLTKFEMRPICKSPE